MKLRVHFLSLICIFYAICSYAFRLSPKELRQRGEKQASTMVDIAKDLKGAESSIPSQQQLEEEEKSHAAEKLYEDSKNDADAAQQQQTDRERMSTCVLPSYRRDYTLALRDFHNQLGLKVSSFPHTFLSLMPVVLGTAHLFLGSCYYSEGGAVLENRALYIIRGFLEGHGSTLVDFRPMSEEDKKEWERKTCLFFPAEDVALRAGVGTPTATVGAKTRPQTGALRVVEQPELPLRSIKQREAAGAAVSTLRSQRTAPSLQGPVSPITGEIIGDSMIVYAHRP